MSGDCATSNFDMGWCAEPGIVFCVWWIHEGAAVSFSCCADRTRRCEMMAEGCTWFCLSVLCTKACSRHLNTALFVLQRDEYVIIYRAVSVGHKIATSLGFQ